MSQQARHDHEVRKRSAKEEVSSLENSLKEQQQVGREIEQLKPEENVAKFYKAKRAKDEIKSLEKEVQKTRDSLALFFKKD